MVQTLSVTICDPWFCTSLLEQTPLLTRSPSWLNNPPVFSSVHIFTVRAELLLRSELVTISQRPGFLFGTSCACTQVTDVTSAAMRIHCVRMGGVLSLAV